MISTNSYKGVRLCLDVKRDLDIRNVITFCVLHVLRETLTSLGNLNKARFTSSMYVKIN